MTAGCYIRFSFWQSRIFVGLEYLESALSQYQDFAGRREVSIEWADEHRISRLLCSILMANQMHTFPLILVIFNKSRNLNQSIYLCQVFFSLLPELTLKTHTNTWLPFPKAAPSASTWVQLRDVIREEMWLCFEKKNGDHCLDVPNKLVNVLD